MDLFFPEIGLKLDEATLNAVVNGDVSQLRKPLTSSTDRFYVDNLSFDYHVEGSRLFLDTLDGGDPIEALSPFGPIGGILWLKEPYFKKASDPYLVVTRFPPHEMRAFFQGHPDHGRVLSSSEFNSFIATNSEWEYVISQCMPRWASKHLLEITDLNCQMLGSITPEDCYREGFSYKDGVWSPLAHTRKGGVENSHDHLEAYKAVWEQRKYTWDPFSFSVVAEIKYLNTSSQEALLFTETKDVVHQRPERPPTRPKLRVVERQNS